MLTPDRPEKNGKALTVGHNLLKYGRGEKYRRTEIPKFSVGDRVRFFTGTGLDNDDSNKPGTINDFLDGEYWIYWDDIGDQEVPYDKDNLSFWLEVTLTRKDLLSMLEDSGYVVEKS